MKKNKNIYEDRKAEKSKTNINELKKILKIKQQGRNKKTN